MSETTQAPAAKSLKKPLLIGSILVAALGISYGLSQVVVSQEFAQKELDAWIAKSEAQAKEQGVHLDISYGGLNFEGSAPPVATLNDVTVNVASFIDQQKTQASVDDAVHVRTDVLEVEPTSLDLTSFSITAPAPIAVRYGTDGFDALTLKADAPLKVATTQEDSPYGTKVSLKHHLPNQYDLTGQDVPTASPVAYTLAFADNSVLATDIILEAPQYGETNLFLGGMKFIASDVALLTIGKGTLEWQKYPNKHGEDVSYSLASLENIAGQSMQALGDASLTWNVQSTSKPVPASEANPFAMESASVDVKKLRLHAQGSSIDVTGQFAADGTDLLPIGHADIVVANPSKLREFLASNGALTAHDEVLIDKLLIGMTGRGINEEGDVEINITREKEGAFMLGKLRFEEVLGILFTHANTPPAQPIEE